MIYRNDPYLDAQFQKAVRAAHDQDWDAFERFSFYDAKMMEDLLYVCENFMPLEAKCRFALEHYDNHGDHSAIIRKYVRRARIIRPENWRNALPESVRDLDTFTVYRGSISSIERTPFSLSWSLSYDIAEWFAHRNELFYPHASIHVYQGTIKADKVIAYLNEREEFEIVQYRNVKDVQEITPLRGYSPQYEKYLAGRSLSLSEREKSKPYFDEWYRAQNP